MRYKATGIAALLILAALSAVPASAFEVSLGESGGVFTVPVQVNQSVTLRFVVDPGAAIVVIPRSVLNTLVANGSVTQNDVIGTSVAELADSSVYRAVQLRLRELRVGDKVVHDVIAAVAPGLTYSLLGQSFLKRFASVTFDNQRRVLILSETISTPTPQYQYQYPNQYQYPTTQSQAPHQYPSTQSQAPHQYPSTQSQAPYQYPTTQSQAPYYPPAGTAPTGGYGYGYGYGYGQPSYWPYSR